MAGDRRLEATYRGYEGAAARRWAPGNAGNRAIHAERNAAFARALSGRRVDRLLEVGCGDGGLLGELRAMVPGARCCGVELLGFRLDRAGETSAPLLQGDGQQLPFPASTFDIVVLSTVLSSIRDDLVARRVAAEAVRVLASGGGVLWYDMRFPNPTNRAVRPMPARRIRSLFPGLAVDVRPVTLLPPIARRLGPRTPERYARLAALPLARSHLLGLLVRPGATRGRARA